MKKLRKKNKLKASRTSKVGKRSKKEEWERKQGKIPRENK